MKKLFIPMGWGFGISFLGRLIHWWQMNQVLLNVVVAVTIMATGVMQLFKLYKIKIT